MTQDYTPQAQIKEINEYGFDSFCRTMQDALKDGWVFDFENNAGYPTSFGTFYTAVLVKQQEALKEATTALVENATEGINSAVETLQELFEGAVEATQIATEVVTDTVAEVTDVMKEVAPRGRPKSK